MPKSNAASFLIVDDHPLFLEALQSALRQSYGDSSIRVAGSIDEALAQLEQVKADLVLLDWRMPGANGTEAISRIRTQSPGVCLAVISAADGPEILAQVRTSAANGFIHKSQSKNNILESVARLLDGQNVFPANAVPLGREDLQAEAVVEKLRQLTPQQLKVLMRVCEAKLNKQIAFELNVTETTVKAHVTLIFKKLGLHSRTQAVLLVQRFKARLLESEFADLVVAAAG